jgi:multiple sugar transport system substrate-binding protein
MLALFALALTACGGEVQQAVQEAAPTIQAAAQELAPTVQAAVEEVAPTVAAAATEMAAPAEEAPAEDAPAEAMGDKTVVKWFVGLGTGGDAAQIEVQNAVVEEFNATHDDIELQIEIVQNTVAYDTVATLIASGDAPDIIGPVGTSGSNQFAGTFLDLQPLVDSTGYDLSQFPQASVDFYRTADGALEGLPFAVYPAMIYYNRDIFDEAGLNYPPHEVGEPYVMPDGTEMPWNYETARDLAMILTVDANGNDATSPDFDAENIVQFGYTDQWPDDFRSICNSWGAQSMVDADNNVVWPDSYQDCLEWMYNGMWTDHFYPNAAWEGSELLATPNVFGSGNIAMALTHLWFTCCIEGAPVDNWDMAVVPANMEGVTTSKLHADTYRILNSTENPEAAFEVLTYLIGEASPQLTLTYGALPIRENEQAAYFEAQDARYPQGVDWSIVSKMLPYPDIPSHEQALPNNNQARDRLLAFVSLLKSDGTLDLNAEVETLVSDLQAIYDAAP